MQAPAESPFWQSVRGILDYSGSEAAPINPLDNSALDRSITNVLQDAEAVLGESGEQEARQADIHTAMELEILSEQLLHLVKQHLDTLGVEIVIVGCCWY
jgi:hypothetical protein